MPQMGQLNLLILKGEYKVNQVTNWLYKVVSDKALAAVPVWLPHELLASIILVESEFLSLLLF